ncbi:sulfite exporter TauE/SafE family protein [Rathayibacter toxicus]|uniref:sulfite exporter TauE/SafE family protein n=1 Tax=Rathayibacter toxicus TaxID=145458 RepID=UPI000CE93249|nr:sulfite exporter TauE/SafE family protein [Rathayibacter toxicus]PPI56506.1 sulfite exporter TauE/SafE family protein [Rathayibacter toxicus]QOD10286.1 sulfite exporter TauE/SafE family protein [Rathayibacter toxicus]QWL28958.1 sulfite exporter TauE/SafE family protein [Rathayibacter toxicus]QWL33143.1 sulfite exporter TauE/SafE family protein [Rathayibacter toxicus]QWL35238.1 sulfite exporter TauE/SafE family protein [Rathayibacter toxicus]
MTDEAIAQRSGARTLMLALIGAVGGILSGACGVGGGILMVPMLIGWYGMDQRRASATSLLAIVPTSVVGATGYAFSGQVAWLPAVVIGVVAMFGVSIGSWLLVRLPLGVLRNLFIALLLVAAVRMALFGSNEVGDVAEGWGVWPGFAGLGLLMGVASGLFGIGGGAIAVPVLVGVFGLADLLAKGTSLAAMIPTAVSGSIANARRGVLDIRAGLLVGLSATIFSVVGVALSFLVPARVSGILFAIVLLLAVVQLVRRGRRS